MNFLRYAWHKVATSAIDLVTSKTTWISVVGYIALLPLPGLPAAVKLAIPLVGKLLAQASADHGKNAAPPIPATAAPPPAAK